MSKGVFDHDSREVDTECVVCEKPTQSHMVPEGYLCHSCLSEESEERITGELAGNLAEGIELDSPMKCRQCSHRYRLNEAREKHGCQISVFVDLVPLPTFSTVVMVNCPRCRKTTEYLTTKDDGVALGRNRAVLTVTISEEQGGELPVQPDRYRPRPDGDTLPSPDSWQ